MKPLCIYHGGCDDGFAAAWAVRHALKGEVEMHAGQYGREPPDVADRDVILVDFSYKRPVLEGMLKSGDVRQAMSILILDHHKTAQEDLAGIEAPHPTDCYDPRGWRSDWEQQCAWPVRAIFDMNRSGAGLAWDFFHTQRNGHVESRPRFIDYIEDRDLWRKALPGSDEFTIALRSYPMDFGTWDRLIAAGPDALIEEGKSIQRYYRLRVEEFKRGAYRSSVTVDGVEIPCMATNAPYFAASEVAGELAGTEGVQFGLCYFEGSNGDYLYSLRSRGDFDVSAVAKAFGGGGHKNASGFKAKEPVHRLAGLPSLKDVDWHVVRDAIGDCFDDGYIGSDKVIAAAFKSNGLIVAHQPDSSTLQPSS